jgi:hypothetical protein
MLSANFQALSTFSTPSVKKIYVVFGAAVSIHSHDGIMTVTALTKEENRCSVSADFMWQLSYLSLPVGL